MSMSLPGSVVLTNDIDLEQNPCEGFGDEKCGKPSRHKIIGESDSFGDEHCYFCTECYQKQRQWEIDNPPMGSCDYCKASNVRLFKHRDIDEGMHGPVYDICQPCRERYVAQLREELEANQDDDDDHIPFDDEDDLDEAWEPVSKGFSALATHDGVLWSVSYNPDTKNTILHTYDPQCQYPQHIVKEPADIAVIIAVLETDADVNFYTDKLPGIKVPRDSIIFHLEEIFE